MRATTFLIKAKLEVYLLKMLLIFATTATKIFQLLNQLELLKIFLKFVILYLPETLPICLIDHSSKPRFYRIPISNLKSTNKPKVTSSTAVCLKLKLNKKVPKLLPKIDNSEITWTTKDNFLTVTLGTENISAEKKKKFYHNLYVEVIFS